MNSLKIDKRKQVPNSKGNLENLEKKVDWMNNIVNPFVLEESDLPQNVIRKKVINLSWNGGIMYIQGYIYIENIALSDENMIYKALILKKNNKEEFEFPLNDVDINNLHINNKVQENYRWAGYEGNINFSKVTRGGAPLPAGQYDAFIKLVINQDDDNRINRIVPLGNVDRMLKNGFYSTKLEYLSSKRLLQYNLMITQNVKLKTLHFESNKLKDLNPNTLKLKSNHKKQKYVNKRLFKWLYTFFCLLPIYKKRVTFASDSRMEMNGNFGFVYKEMSRQELDLDYKFLLKQTIDEKKTMKEIIKLAYWFATSKKIILDDYYPLIYPLKVRKGADLIQVWHAVGAFKTFGYSRVGRPGGPPIKSLNHRNYTKAVVSSKNIVPLYAEGFGIDESAVVPIGVPRTDIFFDNHYKKSKIVELYEKYPYLKGKKVILFAPTFRGSGQSSAHYPYDILNMKKLYEELKGEYIFLFKFHPFIKNKVTIPYQYVDFFYDFSEYREVNDLLFIADILITDYSSVCFEYALLQKPMIFFSFDVEEYIKNRDFYYEYQSFIPGVLAKTTEDIIYSIVNEEFESERIEPFVKYFFDDLDGKSSERFVRQLILDEQENGNNN